MKTETLYVILNQFGKSWVVKDQAIEPASLNEFLADGWRPVRETPFATSPAIEKTASVLILLEREIEGSFGFGFKPM
jgi:hypothetical protein